VEAEAALRRGLAIDEAGDRGSPVPSRRAREVSTLVLSETAPRLPDVEVARILSSLATLLADRGDLREADGLASRARKLYERKLYEKTRGPQHAELAEALITLAAVRASRGDLDEAQALRLRVRRVAELENARPAVRASAVANLGALRMLQGRHQDAEPLLEQGLDLGEKALGGPDHPVVRALAALERIEARDPRRAAVLQGLASLYASQGRRVEAARIGKALAAPRAMLSPGFTVPAAEEP
jgi:tetratricopeptide (TPR) repeat protein